MNKVKVKKITLAEKIYIAKADVNDHDSLIAAYTYNNGTEFLSSIEEDQTHYLVPSNSYHKLEYDEIIDLRHFEKLNYKLEFSGQLRPEQQEAVDKFFIGDRPRSGLLQAKPGFGKTFTACSLISRTSAKTIILVHTKLLFEQWLKEIKSQIPNVVLGKIGDGNFTIGDITVAIYKTAYNNIEKLKNEFSIVITDEAHKCPADMFSSVVNNLNAKVKIALTATPRRKDGKHVFLTDYFSTFKVVAIDSRSLVTPSVKIIETDFKFPIMDPKRDWAKTMNKLCSNEAYLEFCAKLIISYTKNGRCPLIIGERVEMLKTLQRMIPNSICVIGETSNEAREEALQQLGKKYTSILTTKLFDEGISCHRLDTLILLCPTNNNITLEQRIGRIERIHPDKQFPLIVDIWLSGAVVTRQQKNRLAWYALQLYNIL